MNKTVLFGTVAAVAVAAGLYLTASSTENVNVAGVSFNSAIAEIETAAGTENGTFVVDQLTTDLTDTTTETITTLETQAGGMMDKAKEAMGFDAAPEADVMDPAMMDPAMMDEATDVSDDVESMADDVEDAMTGDSMMDKAADMTEDTVDAVVETSEDAYDSVVEFGSDTVDAVTDTTEDVVDGVKGMMGQ